MGFVERRIIFYIISQILFQILTPFMLRRVKADVELNLPPKCEVIVYAPLTKQQTTLYKAVYDNTIEDMLKVSDS